MIVKKKLRDVTFDEFAKWRAKKNIFSDDFLNLEIEIEIKAPDILDKQEKEYLRNVIKPFRDKVEYIAKLNETNGYDYISIGVSFRVGISNFNTEHIWLPYFERGTMYKNMEVGKKYTLEELGL